MAQVRTGARGRVLVDSCLQREGETMRRSEVILALVIGLTVPGIGSQVHAQGQSSTEVKKGSTFKDLAAIDHILTTTRTVRKRLDLTDDTGRFATKLLTEAGADVLRIGRGSPGVAMKGQAGERGGLLDWWYDSGKQRLALGLDSPE